MKKQIPIQKCSKYNEQYYLEDSEKWDTTINLSGRNSIKKNRYMRKKAKILKVIHRIVIYLCSAIAIVGCILILIALSSQEAIPEVEAEYRETIELKIQTTERQEELMRRICDKWSPMCNKWNLFMKANDIFESRWVPFWIALGIMNAESTLGKNYARWCDSSYNNWGWIKWRKLDDGTSVKDQPIPDSNWCYLYKFDSMEDYFISKANTLGIWYKACFTKEKPIRCISYSYVWNPNIAEQSWINNVASIAY